MVVLRFVDDLCGVKTTVAISLILAKSLEKDEDSGAILWISQPPTFKDGSSSQRWINLPHHD